jgi:hypothetical protein
MSLNIKRLRRLADVILPRVHYTKFNMGFYHDGTCGCALGWAGLDPVFRRQGLKTLPAATRAVVQFNGNPFSQSAAAEFFGLTENEAEDLFLPWSYDVPGRISSRHVRDKIYALIKAN